MPILERRPRITLTVRVQPCGSSFAWFGARRRSPGVREFARVRAVRKWSGAVPTERNLVSIVCELRRLNRTITVQLERDLKRAGCPPLESCEVLREIAESDDVRLRPAELRTRLAIPQRRMSQLIEQLAKDGYVERERAGSGAGDHVIVITDSGRRRSKHASSVLLAAVRQFFYGKRRM
jgi:DNA-binding MarR family transcriptional regulator